MDVRVPQLAEGVEGGSIVSILVKEGDTVKEGQDLVELETEKATAAVPATASGKITKIHVAVGASVKVGQVMVSIDGGGAASAPASSAAPASQPTAQAATSQPAPVAQPQAAPVSTAAQPAPVINQKLVEAGLGLAAAPFVRHVARELGIDLTKISGSERGGRITIGDLRNYVARLTQMASAPQQPAQAGVAASGAPKHTAKALPDFSKWGTVRREKATNLRKKISEKMTESWTTVPHVTQYDQADVTNLMKLAKKYTPEYEKNGARLTLTVLLLKAVIAVLKKYPAFNSSFDEAAGELVFKEYINLGIAVDTEQGLIVPVIHNADKKSSLELAKDLKSLADKTKQRKVSIEELQGGSFTISNQGGIGGGAFTPIINTPEVAILGLARGLKKAVVKNDKIQVATVLPLSLSYDHRVIDGGNAARFITDLVSAIENFDEAEIKLNDKKTNDKKKTKTSKK